MKKKKNKKNFFFFFLYIFFLIIFNSIQFTLSNIFSNFVLDFLNHQSIIFYNNFSRYSYFWI
jgi:hypothetical protein